MNKSNKESSFHSVEVFDHNMDYLINNPHLHEQLKRQHGVRPDAHIEDLATRMVDRMSLQKPYGVSVEAIEQAIDRRVMSSHARELMETIFSKHRDEWRKMIPELDNSAYAFTIRRASDNNPFAVDLEVLEQTSNKDSNIIARYAVRKMDDGSIAIDVAEKFLPAEIYFYKDQLKQLLLKRSYTDATFQSIGKLCASLAKFADESGDEGIKSIVSTVKEKLHLVDNS